MNKYFKILTVIILLLTVSPAVSSAASKTSSYYGAWFPFWLKTDAIQQFTANITKFKEVSLFSYDAQPDGTLKDRLKMQDGPWLGWQLALRDLNIKILPTIAWFKGDQIYKTLSNKKLRKAHIAEIVSLAVANPTYGGIDIDYENKTAETKTYFSAFLKELSAALHAKKKILACTIEPRAPLSSRFVIVPKDMAYANDYAVINKYCDEVRIMAYDQGSTDLILNKQKGSNGNFYMPIADKDWVLKVIKETTKTISAKKILLGIPTYGYEYSISQDNGTASYTRLRAISYKDAMDLAASLNITPERNSAGELSFTYDATSTSSTSLALIKHLVSFTDASAISDKIKLAKSLKLKGAILFKLDGENDPALFAELN